MRKGAAGRFPEENGDAENNDVSVRRRGVEVLRRCVGDVEVLRFRAGNGEARERNVSAYTVMSAVRIL